MTEYTLRLPDDDSKALALLNYLRTLDFVEVDKVKDWWDELEQSAKDAIQKGLEQSQKGQTHSDKEARARINRLLG